MNLKVIAFTKNGIKLSKRICKILEKKSHTVEVFVGTGENKTTLKDFCKNGFKSADGLIFVGATGIAVRGIAPYIKNKTTDPAVVVIDDTGKFVISLLSGHIGGANMLTETIAKQLKSTSVITTATDNNDVWAIDDFATKNNYAIVNTRKIKSISSRLLSRKDVTLYTDFDITSELPKNVSLTDEVLEADIIISDVNCEFEEIMLVPKIYSIGIGCKKGTKVSELYNFVMDTLAKEYINPKAVECVASIDIKAEERAIVSLANKLKAPYLTFSSTTLNRVKGEFTSSEFVKKTVGTDNVCERASVRGNNGNLVVKKTSFEGMTIAISKREFTIDFDTKKQSGCN